MAFSSGPQGGISFSTPRYKNYYAITTFDSDGVNNPLDDHLPHDFNRILGQQILTVRNKSTGFVWSIQLDGGTNALSNGYIGSYDNSATYGITAIPEGCQVVLVTSPVPSTPRINRFRVTTENPDNKVYLLEYSPYTNINPLITLETGTIGNADLELKTMYSRFLLG